MEKENDKEMIKSAFTRVKNDVLELGREISELKLEIIDIKNMLDNLINSQLITTNPYEFQENNQLSTTNYNKMHSKEAQLYPTTTPTDVPTHPTDNPTYSYNPIDTPTVPQAIQGLYDPISQFSTGNRGVPTDRQTDRQTDQQMFQHINNIDENIQKASEILDSLDSIKSDIKQKFKGLTQQEMLVFSIIYQLEEQGPELPNYKDIAIKLSLSQSSIRDYVHRMISKGIPIRKYKVNNKQVFLSISPELKKIASLSTIISLREL